MVLFFFGLPGRFSDWCQGIVARLVEAACGSVMQTDATTPEDLAVSLIRARDVPVLIGSREPVPWMRRVLAASNKRFIVALDDPQVTARQLISYYNLNLGDAMRQVGSSCAAIMRCAAQPEGLVLRAQRDKRQPAAMAKAIAQHFELALTPEAIDGIVASSAVANGPEMKTAPEPLSVRAAAVIDAAVSCYSDLHFDAPVAQITWARELFMADGHVPATQAVDITGRVRALLYGPYITLPPGKWVAEVVLGFSQEATDNKFVVDVLSRGTQLAVTSIQPAHKGMHLVDLLFEIAEDNEAPIEFRVVNERSAFDGHVALSHVTLFSQQRIPEKASHILTDDFEFLI